MIRVIRPLSQTITIQDNYEIHHARDVALIFDSLASAR